MISQQLKETVLYPVLDRVLYRTLTDEIFYQADNLCQRLEDVIETRLPPLAEAFGQCFVGYNDLQNQDWQDNCQRLAQLDAYVAGFNQEMQHFLDMAGFIDLETEKKANHSPSVFRLFDQPEEKPQHH